MGKKFAFFSSFFPIFLLILLVGCSSTPSIQKNAQKQVAPAVARSTHRQDFREKIHLRYPQNVYEKFLSLYSRKQNSFNQAAKNSYKYRAYILEVLQEFHLPDFLFYVGLIESHYNLTITSHAGAVGPWQFMPKTAKGHGLIVNSYIDERQNIYFSTRAAAKYFRDLFNIFGNWELALLAYNAGENRIIRAIKKGRTRNYIELYGKGLLPRETYEYIPKMAASISKMEEAIRFLGPEKLEGIQQDLPSRLFLVKAKRKFSLVKLSEELGIEYTLLKKINAHLKKDLIPVGESVLSDIKEVSILIPKGPIPAYVYQLQTPLEKSSSGKIAHKKIIYTVQKGESLQKIAKKFNVSALSIKKYNPLLHTITPGQKITIILAMN